MRYSFHTYSLPGPSVSVTKKRLDVWQSYTAETQLQIIQYIWTWRHIFSYVTMTSNFAHKQAKTRVLAAFRDCTWANKLFFSETHSSCCYCNYNRWVFAIIRVVRLPSINALPAASSRLPTITENDAPHRGYKTSWHCSTERRSLNESLNLFWTRGQSARNQQTYSRELSCVITPLGKPSNVISEQDGRHKVAFPQKGARHFVTLNAWTWQWIHTETITHWHVSDEIWELNSHGCAFSVPNPLGPLKWLFHSAVQKRWVRVWLLLGSKILDMVWYCSRSFRP